MPKILNFLDTFIRRKHLLMSEQTPEAAALAKRGVVGWIDREWVLQIRVVGVCERKWQQHCESTKVRGGGCPGGSVGCVPDLVSARVMSSRDRALRWALHGLGAH